MRLTTTTLSLALFGVVSCASSNRKLSKKSKKDGSRGCSTFLKLFVNTNDRNARTSYYAANFKFGAPPTCVEPAAGFELCTGDQAILRPIPVYTDKALSVNKEIAKLSEIATYSEADDTNLSFEVQGTLIFEDSFGSEIHFAGYAEITDSDNDLAVVGGTGKFAGAIGDIDFLPSSGGSVLEADLCIL